MGDIDKRVEAYKKQAAAAGLEFPVLFKLQTGQKSTYAHTFFCVNNEAGLKEVLEFKGFIDCGILCQAYLPHKERVYKIYGIGAWFNAPVRRSIPD